MNGNNLLAEFRESRSEPAFSDLVRRYTNLVYSVAKRRVGTDLLAQEVTQIVFIRLAKAAPDLRGDAELVAWLHRTTVHVSIDLWRSETRRRAREEKAVAMQIHAAETAPWNDLAPVLDEALNELNDADRAAILLRFFDEKTMQEVGTVFEVSEDAAKMRVSRALDRLRNQLSARGVTCSAVALAAILPEKAVEAAPAQFVNTLAAFKWPVRAGLGAGVLSVLPQMTTVKLLVGVGALVGVGVATFIVLRSPDSNDRLRGSNATDIASAGVDAGGQSEADGSSQRTDGKSSMDAESPPDPLKLLQTVARARQRIVSGVVELQLSSRQGSIEYAHWIETNGRQLKIMFDGQKLNFEQVGREYAYTLPGEKAEDQKKRIETEKLDKRAAIEAGLLRGFEARYVTVYDGKTVWRYRETDGKQDGTVIDEPGRSATYLFDPRCLGLRTHLFASSTAENCLGLNQPKSIKLIGKEALDGAPAWHVQVHTRYDELLDFWIDEAVPARVVKHAKGKDVVLSKYSGRNPIPIEVTATEQGRRSVPSVTRFVQTRAELDVPIDATTFTLAGLGMPVGTPVSDIRIHRRIGYWTGTGLSENLPTKKANEVHTPPNLSEMLTTLENDPASEAALQAATWIVLNTPDGPEVEKASDVILREHVENTNLVQLAEEMDRMRHRSSTNLLEAMLEKNPNPEVRAIACFTLATFAKDEAKYGENKKATGQAERLFERVIADFAGAGRKGSELAEKAQRELYELRTLTIGKPAPEAAGVDLDGEPMKLSDFRGNVVLLTFWEGEYHEAEEHGKLAERFSASPFALVSVNTDRDLNRAKAMAEKYKITWRSFRDGHRNGPIWTTWNANSWPNVYVLDRNGTIRYRKVYGGDLVKAVETLLAE